MKIYNMALSFSTGSAAALGYESMAGFPVSDRNSK